MDHQGNPPIKVFVYKEKKLFLAILKLETGTSLVVQWLKLCASNTGDASSIPGREIKTPHAAQCG